MRRGSPPDGENSSLGAQAGAGPQTEVAARSAMRIMSPNVCSRS